MLSSPPLELNFCDYYLFPVPPWLNKLLIVLQIDEVGSLFLFSFLKSLVVLLLPFIPLPENKGLKFAGYVFGQDTIYTNILIEKLMEILSLVTLLSCILGRLAYVIIALNLSKDIKEAENYAFGYFMVLCIIRGYLD